MKEIILIGGGGHCRSVIDVIEVQAKYKIAGIVDKKELRNNKILGYEVIADDSMLSQLVSRGYLFVITVGHLGSSETRAELYSRLKEMGAEFPAIISPRAYVSRHANIGEGTVVFHGANVNAGANIGINNIINTHSIIEHDVTTGSHSHISTAAVINGDCKIGSNCFVGSSSVIIQGKVIGDNVVIGANSTVLKNHVQAGTYVGSPAQRV